MKHFYLVIFPLFLLAASPLTAQEEDSQYSARVTVEQSSDNAEEAKKRALLEGEARAFREVLARLDPDRAGRIVEKVTPPERSAMLESLNIERELMRAGRYQADIRYTFNKDQINRLVRSQQSLVPDMNPQALVVVPIYNSEKGMKLWRGENIWRSLFSSAALEQGRGQIILPYGDPSDQLLVDLEDVLGGNEEVLKALAQRYGAANLVIAIAQPQPDGRSIDVILRRPGDNRDEEIVLDYEAENAQETQEIVMARAARDLADRLIDSASRFSLFTKPEDMKPKAKVIRAEFRHGREWLRMQSMLKGLPGVELLDIGAVAPNYAQLTVYYIGSPGMISRALQARGVQVDSSKKFWTIRLR